MLCGIFISCGKSNTARNYTLYSPFRIRNSIPCLKYISKEHREMDFVSILKGVIDSFAFSLGMQMLAFYMARFFSGISKERFGIVFVAAGVASLAMVCGSLLHAFRTLATPEVHLFLPGCVGGWLGGILLSLTYAKPLLIRLWR
jgi:hypothetical protein